MSGTRTAPCPRVRVYPGSIASWFPSIMADQQPSNPVAPASGFTNIGNELDPTAPLWRVYRDEVRHHDQNVTFDEWNKTLDILLIFAGLFSAVVTSFLVASYPLLSPVDENDNAIHALAMAINSSITLPTPNPSDPVTVSALWVNGLWFTSLFVALAVAFFAILAKQWLVEYNHRMADPPVTIAASLPAHSDMHSPATHHSATPHASKDAPTQSSTHFDTLFPTASLAWARRRQFFFDAFAEWHIPVLITQVLPLLLHVALFLFLVGLCVFVWTLNVQIARGVTFLTILLFSLYWIATVLPVFRADCPTATPLVRRAPEVPTWIAITAVRLWRIIIPVFLRVFRPSRVTSLDPDRLMTDLHQRRKRIRDSGWLDGGLTTDEEVKLDTLQWLILVSGSETAITAAFQALGALPPDSKFLPSLRTITAGMDTAIERLGNSPVPPTAVEIIRAVRSELILGRGSWDLTLLGLDLSSLFTQTLRDSNHSDARLLSAALHLDGTLATSAKVRSFMKLYDITVELLRRDNITDSCVSAARLLLEHPCIPAPALACLSVLLVTRSLHIRDSDRQLIMRVFDRLPHTEYCARGLPHICDGFCVIIFALDGWQTRGDPAHCRVSPITLSYLLPCLMPSLTRGIAPCSLSDSEIVQFHIAICAGHWQDSPCPTGNADVEALLTLLSLLASGQSRAWYKKTSNLLWERFMSTSRYQALRSHSVMAQLRDILTCDPRDRPWLLQNLICIVHNMIVNKDGLLTPEERTPEGDFLLSLISVCQDLMSMDIDEDSRDILLRIGLVPEIGCSLYCVLGSPRLRLEFLDMVKAAVRLVVIHVENKAEYLLHIAQHCVLVDFKWVLDVEEVLGQVDARILEDMLVREGPCNTCRPCSDMAAKYWPGRFTELVQARSPAVGEDSESDEESAPLLLGTDSLSTTGPHLDLASSPSAGCFPNPSPIESGRIPILKPGTSEAGKPVPDRAAMLRILQREAGMISAVAALSGTMPTPVIEHSPLAVTPRDARPPAGLDNGVSPVAVVSHWHPGPASRGDGASTAYVAQDPPSQIPSSVGQGHGDDTTHTSRAISALSDDAPSGAAVRMATSSAATGSSSTSTSALDVPTTVRAATASLPTIASSPYAAATTTSSPDSPAAHSHARTADVPTARASPSEHDTAGVDVDPGSSAV